MLHRAIQIILLEWRRCCLDNTAPCVGRFDGITHKSVLPDELYDKTLIKT
uniref:Uncharacterized protein n=1 Tax=uncultured bacterium B19D1_C12D4_E9D6 TaxID=1329637 RepID=S4W8Z5_9BACT|nr:hypothetical protein [uncultured bacterium B19D1_C12D4_E9D6]